MFIELVDLLRCPEPHRESQLVLAIASRRDRHIMNGTLGCPVCGATYRVVDGVVEFASLSASSSESADESARTAEELGGYLAAEAGHVIVATHSWSDAVVSLTELVPLRGVAIGGTMDAYASDRVVKVSIDGRIPVADRSVNGIAIERDGDFASSEIARVLAPGGRVIAPAGMAGLARLDRIASNDSLWIGRSAQPTIQLTRRATQ